MLINLLANPRLVGLLDKFGATYGGQTALNEIRWLLTDDNWQGLYKEIFEGGENGTIKKDDRRETKARTD